MQREWPLVRRILKSLEAREDLRSPLRPDELEGFAPEVVSYHIRLLMEAGLIHGECSRTMGAPLSCMAYSLTWEGHEFLDQVRDEKSWNSVVRVARDKGLSLSFEIIKAVVGKLAAAALT